MWEKKYSVCEETGLRVCEIYEHLFVREDGMIKATSEKTIKKYWNAGSGNTGRYKSIKIPLSKKHIPIHRLVAMSFIPKPSDKTVIDHIDRNKINNSVNNLRWCTKRENSSNTDLHSKGHLLGTCYNKKTQMYKSTIFCGKYIFLGYYNTAEDAHRAYADYTNSKKLK